ncbi:MAG: response regulator [Phycisphaerales bacterium]|nr:response regulator [Phycisphaerales bacterium]
MAEERVNILLIEDDEDDFIITRDLLNEIGPGRYHLDWVDSVEKGRRQLQAGRHDVYLIDYRIGQSTGLELLREAHDRGVDAPMILLTGASEHEIDVAAMKAGAADYLIKGQINAPLLERSIRYSMEQARHLRELRDREAQLLQAQKMEAVGRLAGGVAHDFNNLLTAITGYTELLLSRLGDDNDLSHDVQEIKRAAERAAELTRQLLTFSRKQVILPKVLDLNALVGDVERMLQRLIGEQIRLLTDLDTQPLPILADPSQIEQVVMNLAVNSRDAMPKGGTLTIGTQRLEAGSDRIPPECRSCNQDMALLSVADTGVGIDPRTMQHIFEPFFTTKDPDKGTGLGLSTVYAVVKQVGGGIQVNSEVGQGTRFDLFVPLAQQAVVAPQSKVAEQPRPQINATLLLVEDQSIVRKLMRRLLQAEGYTVLEAPHGREAIRVARAHSGPIDLLVTDVVMPEMSGQQLARELVALRPDLRVLFVSGYADSDLYHEVAGQGTGHFLQKPFTPDILGRKIRDILTNGRH